jgi:hypothetical protein
MIQLLLALTAIGHVLATTTGNVTGASARETVELRVYKVTPAGPDDEFRHARLVVRAPGGTILWQSPPVQDYGEGPAGDTPLEVAGDGQVIIRERQSDARVEQHRVLRWDGHRLVQRHSAGLVETPSRSGNFIWSKDSTPRSRWISRFNKLRSAGHYDVTISTPDGKETRGVVLAAREGFSLLTR